MINVKNKALLKPELLKKFPEIEIFLGNNFKYTSGAYGWSNDTLLMYPEENFKHMFYMCKGKDHLVSYDRRFIYYIKPQSFNDSFEFNINMDGKPIEGTAKIPKIKIPLKDLRVIEYKDPFRKSKSQLEIIELKKRLNDFIGEIDLTIKHII